MSDRHLAHWPPGLPCHLTLPQTHLFHNAEVSAARYPDKPFLVFYDTLVTFRQFQQQAEHIAGFLQQVCGVKAGDRVVTTGAYLVRLASLSTQVPSHGHVH